MYDRIQIKENAKLVLKRSYWMAFLVSLLVSVVSSNGTRFSESSSNSSASSNMEIGINGAINQLTNGNPDQAMAYLQQYMPKFITDNLALSLSIGVILALVFSIAWTFFVSTPANIGLSRFFIATREQQNPVNFNYVLYGFKNNYIKQAWASFSTNLILGLWALLAVIPIMIGTALAVITESDGWIALSTFSILLMIPAIIKKYQYSFVDHILANNCEISGSRARELSTKMTDGRKWDLFVLDLSFIGWLLLGSLLCGFGVLFVVPYMNAAKAEAYTCLKAEAMQVKKASTDDELPSLIGAQA